MLILQMGLSHTNDASRIPPAFYSFPARPCRLETGVLCRAGAGLRRLGAGAGTGGTDARRARVRCARGWSARAADAQKVADAGRGSLQGAAKQGAYFCVWRPGLGPP